MIKHDWKKIDGMFDTKSNRELSDMFGIDMRVLSNRRRNKHIRKVSKWEKFVKFLGIKTDRELAKELNITVGAVVQKRLRSGIPSPSVSGERKIQDLFKKTLNVKYAEYVRTRNGIIDILTDASIYEIKQSLTTTQSHMAVGQLLLYSNSYPNRELIIVCGENVLNQEGVEDIYRLGIKIIEFQK